MKTKHYTLTNIMKIVADYYVIFGERSNGKTFAVLELILRNWLSKNEQGVVLRRYDTDIKGHRGIKTWENFINNEERGNIIKSMTKGRYNYVKYESRSWRLCHLDEESGEIDLIEENPFCYALSLNEWEHDKSTALPGVTTVFFDEFITRNYYLRDEFVIFCNVLSTIIRNRDNVKIFMCGNTVSKFCPYFKEMGLTNILKMKKGVIDTYKYGDSDLTVAVEYSDYPAKTKKSDKYFAFNNPKLKMITRGEWELDIYPHLPYRYKPKDVQYMYFIKFENQILQCEIILAEGNLFTYIHQKTTPVRDDSIYLVYQADCDPRPNYRRRLTLATNPLEKKLISFFNKDKVFYQDNEVGELVKNYIQWSRSIDI